MQKEIIASAAWLEHAEPHDPSPSPLTQVTPHSSSREGISTRAKTIYHHFCTLNQTNSLQPTTYSSNDYSPLFAERIVTGRPLLSFNPENWASSDSTGRLSVWPLHIQVIQIGELWKKLKLAQRSQLWCGVVWWCSGYEKNLNVPGETPPEQPAEQLAMHSIWQKAPKREQASCYLASDEASLQEYPHPLQPHTHKTCNNIMAATLNSWSGQSHSPAMKTTLNTHQEYP